MHEHAKPSLLAAMLLAPLAASAGTVVACPPIGEGLDAKALLGVHQLIAAELDFMAEFDGVSELEARPDALNAACLESTACLKTLTVAGAGDHLITGVVTADGGDYAFDLLLYDVGTDAIVRRIQRVSAADPSALSNNMTAIVREVATGEVPEAEESSAVAVYAESEEEFLIGDDPAVVEVPMGDDELAELITFGPPAPKDPETATDPAELALLVADIEATPEVEVVAVTPVEIIDTIEPSPGIERPLASILQLTARGGVAKYYSFDFVTAGGELAVPVASGLHVIAGFETYAVQRTLPPEIQVLTGQFTEWNTIFPLNMGVIYKIPLGLVQVYGGADGITVQYYRDEIGADWAGGARARLGADVMLSDNLGVNVNSAIGFWNGANWPYIEPGVGASGPLPQVNGGVVAMF